MSMFLKTREHSQGCNFQMGLTDFDSKLHVKGLPCSRWYRKARQIYLQFIPSHPGTRLMYNRKILYTFHQQPRLDRVRKRHSRQERHLALSIRIRRNNQGLEDIIHKGQNLWRRSCVLRPRYPSGSIWVKVVDEVD